MKASRNYTNHNPIFQQCPPGCALVKYGRIVGGCVVECVIFEEAADKVKGDVLRVNTCTSLHLLLDKTHSVRYIVHSVDVGQI